MFGATMQATVPQTKSNRQTSNNFFAAVLVAQWAYKELPHRKSEHAHGEAQLRHRGACRKVIGKAREGRQVKVCHECLCRCSSLYSRLTDQKMWELFYEPHRRNRTALHTDDCIYTPGVTVFKTDVSAPELLGETDWYNVDVITCAAPNLRYGDVSITDEALKQLHIKRLRRILDIAILNKVENIVLGAFGCGAFMNDPKVVAAASAEVIKDYLFAFKTIEFAVFCRPGYEQNYREFRNYLESE